MSFFKAYDMRGTFGVDFTLETVYKVGKALPKIVGGTRWLVGRDCRESSPAVRTALVAGLRAAGVEVTDLGLSTTPMVYFFTAEEDFDGSVMITASHNPPTDNGLKVSKRGALPVGYESGLAEVERLVAADPDTYIPQSEDDPSTGNGHSCPFTSELDPTRLPRYIAWLKSHATTQPTLQPSTPNPLSSPSPLTFTPRPLRFAVDCSDGMASILAHELFPEAVFINDTPNGAFPHHSPNPLLAASREQLASVVRERHLDCGVIFDGDADRCMFVDETGAFIQPDYLIPVLASTFFPEPGTLNLEPETLNSPSGLRPAIIHDVRTSRAAIEAIRAMGCEPVIGKVGHAYAKVLLRQVKAVCGGELAGHYYFRDFHGCDSGELAALRILGAFAQAKAAGQTVSQAMKPICGKYANSGEVNFKVEDKPAAIARVLAAAKAFGTETRRCEIDGVRLEFADGWLSVRQSNTEPYLRLLAECDTQARLNQWMSALSSAISAP